MSDYIGSVIAKSLNLAAVVQPRLPSLFELPQAAGRPVSPHTFAEAAGEPESPEVIVATVALPRPQEPDVDAQSQRDRSADNPRGQINNATLAPTALQAVQLMTNKTQVPQQTQSNAPTGIHPIVSRMPAVEHPMTAQLATQQESAQAAAHNKPRLEMVEPRHPMQVQPVITRKETEQAAVHSILQPQTVQRLEPAILQAIRPLLPATVVAQQREMLRPERGARSTGAPQASAEPAPTIQVTIGRIEVRATSPAAPTQRQKAASPAMSLEEYLGGRARRGGA